MNKTHFSVKNAARPWERENAIVARRAYRWMLNFAQVAVTVSKPVTMGKIQLALVILFINVLGLGAQTIYMTKKGHLMLSTEVGKEPVNAESTELSVLLNYTDKQIVGSLDLRTLQMKIPEVNAVLKEAEDPLMVYFTGNIPTDFLSSRHDPIDFNWPVTVSFQDNSFQVILRTTLTHLEEGQRFSCLLSAMGELLAVETGLEEIIPGLDKAIEIRFAQMVLKLE